VTIHKLRIRREFSGDLEKPHPAVGLFWIRDVVRAAGDHPTINVTTVLNCLADTGRLMDVVAVVTEYKRAGSHPPRRRREMVANAFVAVIAVIEAELK